MHREFKLKPYFNKLLITIEQIRKQTFNEPVERYKPTMYYSWDNQEWLFGSKCLVLHPKQVKLFIKEDISKIYHLPDLTLKIFLSPYPLTISKHNFHWGNGSKLLESSIIQNYFHLEKLSPKIIDIVSLIDGEFIYPAQVTQYIEHLELNPFDADLPFRKWKQLKDYAASIKVIVEDLTNLNMRNDQFVDFENSSFCYDHSNWIRCLMEIGLAYGGDTNIPYQSVEVLNIKGRRDNLQRSKFIKINPKELPNNFTVLDIGCNGAFFLRRAMEAGAIKGVGVDIDRVAKAAYFLNQYLGYLNMDFQISLPEEQFDLVFFLSMDNYLPVEDAISRTKHILYFEGHGGNPAQQYLDKLTPYFKKVEVLGKVFDYPESGERVIIKCLK